jgi:hypothetical protein
VKAPANRERPDTLKMASTTDVLMRRHDIAALTLGGVLAVMITCAHALPVSEWQCGDITVQIVTTRGADPGRDPSHAHGTGGIPEREER